MKKFAGLAASLALGMSLLLLVTGCESKGETGQVDAAADVTIAVDSTIDMSPPTDTIVQGPIDGCTRDEREKCLYQSKQTYSINVLNGLVFRDTTVNRDIPVRIRYPSNATGKLPVVILSHGGAAGNNNGFATLENWGTIISKAGYVVIHVAYKKWTQSEREGVCQTLKMTTAECESFKLLDYYRPINIKTIINDLGQVETKFPELAGRLDSSRIVVAGHSSGCGATLMVAGATRGYGAKTVLTLDDPRPIAFLCYSPQGPGFRGFPSDSFDAIKRPILLASGLGDDLGDGLTGLLRLSGWDTMQPGDKYKLYINDEDAIHVAMSLSDATPKRIEAALVSTTLAFLDKYVMKRQSGADYLASDNLKAASDSRAQLSVR